MPEAHRDRTRAVSDGAILQRTMRPVRDTFCSFCGTAYTDTTRYPRRCDNAACGVTVWDNAVPVAVLLVPVVHGARRGLLVLRRGIEPQRGRVALPGGFLEAHETWQQGAARELHEELDVAVDPHAVEAFWFVSTDPRPNRVLLFGVAPAMDVRALGPFSPNTETVERGVVFGPDDLASVMAFPLHVAAAQRWFAAAGITGPHDYTAV